MQEKFKMIVFIIQSTNKLYTQRVLQYEEYEEKMKEHTWTHFGLILFFQMVDRVDNITEQIWDCN